MRSRSVSAGGPSSCTRATRCRPNRNRASSPGSPTRRSRSPPAPVESSPWSGAWIRTVPGNRRRVSRAMVGRRFHSAAVRSRDSSRGRQSGWARRRSAVDGRRTRGGWRVHRRAGCSPGSTTATGGPGPPGGDRVAPPPPPGPGPSGRAAASAGSRPRRPAAVPGTTRCAARSRATQPSLMVGVSGPREQQIGEGPAFHLGVPRHVPDGRADPAGRPPGAPTARARGRSRSRAAGRAAAAAGPGCRPRCRWPRTRPDVPAGAARL